MPYYRCPECAFTVRGDAGRFTPRACPRCSVPLAGADRIYAAERPPPAISQRYPAEATAATSARHALATMACELDDAQLHVAALLTTELVANSLEHSGMDGGGSVRLDASLSDQVLRVEVGDEGSGFVPVPRTIDAPLDSHWGLHLVEELADRWGVVSEPRTLVWFELDRCDDGSHGTEASAIRPGVPGGVSAGVQ